MKNSLKIKELKKEISKRKLAEKSHLKCEQYHLHLSRQILEAHEEDRKEISRELHDVISQILIGINLNLAALKKETTHNSKDIKKKIADTQRLVEKSVKAVHLFARKLRPSLLDDLGLLPAIRSYIKEISTRSDIKIVFKAFAGVEKLNNFNRTLLYRITQEALINVIKHAKASQVHISIKKLKSSICLIIQDDGKSFQIERLLKKKNQGLGLIGMRERLEIVSGSLEINSAEGKGTIIKAFIPIMA